LLTVLGRQRRKLISACRIRQRSIEGRPLFIEYPCLAPAQTVFVFWNRKMRRKTYRQIRAQSAAGHHHNVYVVLLSAEAAAVRAILAANPRRDPKKPCVYVGMTGLAPEVRFANHKSGLKAAKVVRIYGVRLMPELYAIYNPMPFDAALVMERELADDLRRQGYTVMGGH
jgi:hypothetical protein